MAKDDVPAANDNNPWAKGYDEFVHGRMARVQAAAQQWLVTMTTLLGVFSAVVVVGGGNTVDGVNCATARWVVVALAGFVYLLAFFAVYLGAKATFGGLGLRPATGDEKEYACNADYLQKDQTDADGQGRISAIKKLTDLQPDKRKRIDLLREWWSPPPLSGGLDDYIKTYELKTNRLRVDLHHSRILGMLAAMLSGVLGWVVLLLHATKDPPKVSSRGLVLGCAGHGGGARAVLLCGVAPFE